jgi:hypothetical protein
MREFAHFDLKKEGFPLAPLFHFFKGDCFVRALREKFDIFSGKRGIDVFSKYIHRLYGPYLLLLTYTYYTTVLYRRSSLIPGIVNIPVCVLSHTYLVSPNNSSSVHLYH